MTELTLPELKSDTRKDLQSFLRAVNTAFGCRCQEHLGENGLLGFCVTDDQWALLPGVSIPDGNNPGNFIIANRPTVVFTEPPELGAAAAVLKQYEIAFRRNSAISEALRNLKNTIIASLPDSDIDELSDPTMGLVSVTSLEILQHLRTRYGIFVASDFGSFRRSLEETIGTRTFAEVAAAHRLIHVQFGTANQNLSEIDKCRYLRASIASNVAMTTAVTSYLTTHPQIIQQTFAGLTAHITEQAPNFTVIPNDFGYAASSIATKDPHADYFDSTAFAAFLDKRINAALPKHNKAQPPKDSPRLYCYKHGYNFHSSDKCRKMSSDPESTPAMRAATKHTDVKNGSVQGL